MAHQFNIELHRYGTVMAKGKARPVGAGLVGDYYRGKSYQPNGDDVRAILPCGYRKAFERALKWWQSESMSGRRFMPLKCELTSVRGKPMGTLYATPDWTIEEGRGEE